MDARTSTRFEDSDFSFVGLAVDPVVKHHQQHGEFYEVETLVALRDHLRKAGTQHPVVIDAGGHIGNHTVFFSHACPDATVITFEMNPKSYGYLSSNVETNDCGNVTLVNKGVSDREGSCGIRHDATNPLGGAQLDLSGDDDEVVLTTIDTELGSLVLPEGARVDLIKIDIEGHELQCLRGARETLTTHQPLVFLECKEVDEFLGILSLLEECGYEVVEPAAGNLPNFLFVHRERIPTFFTEADLYAVRKDLSTRHVAAWQLIRTIRILERELAQLRAE